MKLKELIAYLEEVAPLRYQEPYDNAGLITGDPDMELTGVLVSLDATPEVIDEAISKGCNAVVSHHPIVFKGIKKFDPHYYVHKSIIKAIKHDVALYAIHTNLDNVLQNGVNQKITQKLSLQDVKVLRPHPQAHLETLYELGSGAIGKLPSAMGADQLIDHVKSSMSLKMVRHTKKLAGEITQIAVCGGSGSFLLSAAKSAGAQAFITADYKYHEFFDANDEILILDIGHYESEYYTNNFAAHCTEAITNPVFYS